RERGAHRGRIGYRVRFAVRVHEEGDRQLARPDLHVLDTGAVTVMDLQELIVDVEVQTVVVAPPAPHPAVREHGAVLTEESDLPERARDVVERRAGAIPRAIEAGHHHDAPARAVIALDESAGELRLDHVIAFISEAPLRIRAVEDEAHLLSAPDVQADPSARV